MPSKTPSVKSIVNTITDSLLRSMVEKTTTALLMLNVNASDNGYTPDNITTYGDLMAFVIDDINRGISQNIFVISGQKLQVNMVLTANCMPSGLETVVIYSILLGAVGSIFIINSSTGIVSLVDLITSPPTLFFTDLSMFDSGCELARESLR
jgi:hypothetical protein